MSNDLATDLARRHPPIERWEWIAVLLAMVVGGVLRLWGIAHLPPGLWYDEAIIGVGALRILHEPGWPIFFMIENHPEEPLFYYLNALGILLGSDTGTTLRVVSAAIGTMTIPVVWWTARQLFGPRVAFWTLLLFTGMRWHIHFSRLSFRTILSPMFASLAAGMLVRYLRTMRTRDAALFGFALAAGLYTYLSIRLFVCIAGVACVLAWWWGRRVPAKHIVLAAAVFLATFAPLGIDYLRNPEHFHGRQGEVKVETADGSTDWARLGAQARDVALMFALRGDHVGKHNIPGPPRFNQALLWSTDGRESRAEWQDFHATSPEPMDPHGTGVPVFDIVTGAVFYAGLLIAIRRMLRRSWPEAFIVSWLLVGSLASILSFGAPNMLRLLFLSPVAAMFIAIAVDRGVHALLARGMAPRVACIAPVVLLAWFGAGEARRYFVDWAGHPSVWNEFNTPFAEAARMARSLPDVALPVVAPDYVAGAPTFSFELGRGRSILAVSCDPASPKADIPRSCIAVEPLAPMPVWNATFDRTGAREVGLVTDPDERALFRVWIVPE